MNTKATEKRLEQKNIDELVEVITKYKSTTCEIEDSKLLRDTINDFALYASQYILDEDMTIIMAIEKAIAYIEGGISHDLRRGMDIITALVNWLQGLRGLPRDMPFENYKIEVTYKMSGDDYWRILAMHVRDILNMDIASLKADKVATVSELISVRVGDSAYGKINSMVVTAFAKYAIRFQTTSSISDLEALQLAKLHVLNCITEIKKNYKTKSVRQALSMWVKGLSLELSYTEEMLNKHGIDTFWYCVSDILLLLVTREYKDTP